MVVQCFEGWVNATFNNISIILWWYSALRGGLMPLSTIFQLYCGGSVLRGGLMPLSTIFQLYCGGIVF